MFDDKGNAFLGILWIQKNGLPGYWGHGPGANGIFVRRSPDGGRTWEKNPVPVLAWQTGTEPGFQYEDMPRVFADNNLKSPHTGNLYVGWIEWQIDKSIMLFARSTDHGATWSKPVRISTQAGLPRDDNGDVVGFHPARRSDWKPRLGTCGDLARSLDVSTHESRLCRRQIRMREVVLLPIGHRELAITVGGVRFSRQCRLQDRYRLIDPRTIARCHEGLSKHDLDEGRVGRERNCLPQRLSLHSASSMAISARARFMRSNRRPLPAGRSRRRPSWGSPR